MVSIVVPVYCVEDYITKCLISITNSTYKDFEVICVNDCSHDNSSLLIKEMQKIDKRIRIIDNYCNKGLGGARNTGIDAAKGEYILFVDADDQIDSRFIEKMVFYLKYADSVVCGMQLNYTVSGDCLYHSTLINDTQNHFYYDIEHDKTILVNFWPSAVNKIYKTDIIRKYAIRYKEKILYEDHTFYYEYFSYIKSFVYLDEPLYIYNKERVGSITTTSIGRETEIFKVLDWIKDIFLRTLGENWEFYYRRVAIRLACERTWVLEERRNELDCYLEEAYAFFKKNGWTIDDLLNAKDDFISANDRIFDLSKEERIRKYVNDKTVIENKLSFLKNFVHEKIHIIKRKIPIIRKLYIFHDNLLICVKVTKSIDYTINNLESKIEKKLIYLEEKRYYSEKYIYEMLNEVIGEQSEKNDNTNI